MFFFRVSQVTNIFVYIYFEFFLTIFFDFILNSAVDFISNSFIYLFSLSFYSNKNLPLNNNGKKNKKTETFSKFFLWKITLNYLF